MKAKLFHPFWHTGFHEYFTPTDEEFKELWETATFVFDANVLLNLYRLTDKYSDEFLDTLRKVPDRIWMPYQVGLEFMRRQREEIKKSRHKYDDYLTIIRNFKTKLENERKEDFMEIFDKLLEYLIPIEQEITEAQESAVSVYEPDHILNAVEELFEGMVGDGFSDEDLEEIYKEGKERYENKIPPGYCDAKDKPEPDRYGDLVIWKEMIKFSQDHQVHIIFVTDDGKEDWWWISGGGKVGPRYELRREFSKETKQVCYIYSMEGFLKFAKKYINPEISDEAIEEVRELQEAIDSSYLREIPIEKWPSGHTGDYTDWSASQGGAIVQSLLDYPTGAAQGGAITQSLQDYVRLVRPIPFDPIKLPVPEEWRETTSRVFDQIKLDIDFTPLIRAIEQNVDLPGSEEIKKVVNDAVRRALQESTSGVDTGQFPTVDEGENTNNSNENSDVEKTNSDE